MALLAAYIAAGFPVAPAAAQTQSPSTINPANPSDRTLTNPQDRPRPRRSIRKTDVVPLTVPARVPAPP